jgi:hypothetical protein
LKDVYNLFLKDLIVSDFSFKDAYKTAKNLFGSTEVNFAGIDGTEYKRPLFDLVIFYGGAYACKGKIKFTENSPPEVEYSTEFIEEGIGHSSCIPVYINEVMEVDQDLLQYRQETLASTVRPLTDESITDNASISNWIMTFAELYLAYKLATNS